jgi:hypothetical protein
MSPEQLKTEVGSILPDLLSSSEIQSIIVATVAMQAISAPGALGDLTGLRSWLKEEIVKTIQAMK